MAFFSSLLVFKRFNYYLFSISIHFKRYLLYRLIVHTNRKALPMYLTITNDALLRKTHVLHRIYINNCQALNIYFITNNIRKTFYRGLAV